MVILVKVDGACHGNPGPMGIGAIGWEVNLAKDGSIFELSEFIGHGTPQLAEYRAVVRALEECLKLEATKVLVNCDSLVVVKQMMGDYKCNVPALDNERRSVLALATRFCDGVTFHHIYDDVNTQADWLARAALKRGRNSQQCQH